MALTCSVWSPAYFSPSSLHPLVVQISTVLWIEGDRDGLFGRAPHIWESWELIPDILLSPPPPPSGRNHSSEDPLGTKLPCHGKDVMCTKSVCSSYSFQDIQSQIFFFLYCNFSIGIPDFHKGSLIHGWPSKSVFSRDSWFTAKGHSRVHGVNRVRGLYVYYLTPSGQDSSQVWCWWQNQSQMGMWPSPLRCGVVSGSIAGTMVGKPSSRV